MADLAVAMLLPEETAAVGRIVGETPNEVSKKMSLSQLDLNHSSFYTIDSATPWDMAYDKKVLLEYMFPENSHFVGAGWSWLDIKSSMSSWIKNELLYNADESNLLFEGASLDECEIVGAVPPIDLVGDVCSLVNDCIVKDNIGWCSFDAVIVVIPYGSAAVGKTIIKLFSLGSVGVKFVMKFGIDSMSHFTVLLHESKATTTKVIDILNDVPIKQSSALTRRTLKIVKHYDGVENGVEVLADLKKVAKLDGSDRLIKNFDDQLENTEALKGPEYHAKLAANRLDTAGDKLRLEKDYAVNYFDPIDNKMKPGKADFDIVDENDIQRIGIEAKSGKLDVSSAAPKHMREDLLRKLHRMDAAVNLKKVDKAVINVPSMSNVDTSVKQYIDENNLKVIIEEVNP